MTTAELAAIITAVLALAAAATALARAVRVSHLLDQHLQRPHPTTTRSARQWPDSKSGAE